MLWDDRGGPLASPTTYTFNIRPEELQYEEPTRTNIVQTMGGAFVDDFGLGIKQVTIQGHTGWRGRSAAGGPDGAAFFRGLHEDVFLAFYRQRRAAVDAGRDPGTIFCVFTDALHDVSASVLPTAFQLRRNKSRPLLHQYKISMVILGDS